MTTRFDIHQDNELIEAGTHFWCSGCMVAKPLDDKSRDPRYCQGCYELFSKEKEIQSPVPQPPPQTSKKGHGSTPQLSPDALSTRGHNCVKAIPVSQDVPVIMSTLKGKKAEAEIIQPTVGKVALGKRGPKHRLLPERQIRQWAAEGMKAKAIATRLKADGIVVSYKTVQRILKGERLLI